MPDALLLVYVFSLDFDIGREKGDRPFSVAEISNSSANAAAMTCTTCIKGHRIGLTSGMSGLGPEISWKGGPWT
ncbi:hypothetical protein L1987_03154 [Smallanthus sonchifolius]|uniref:Uncharacterized protein n=1 Tax=Smallanthus sonchifolius TaxID=185202 RepID=A0ACB9KA25_9ASTR|nr:hypothetical protein L1987_03154 [Smallanthus sonchifolius]